MRRRTLLLSALPAAALLGCGKASSSAGGEIDAAWHRKALLEGHLQHWVAVAPEPNGFFKTRFTRDWQPKGDDKIELTLQGRLTYAMSIGYELTQEPRYLQAARQGAEFLLQHFADPVEGGFYHVVASDGRVLVDGKQSYGHAFALLALAHLARVTKGAHYREAALRAWADITRGLIDTSGGLYVETGRNFVPGAGGRTQNPVMHMFEATLALLAATGDAQAQKGARALGDFVVYQLMQGLPDGSARIPEWYDEHWKPLPTKEAGAYFDLGHQFEWSHLLLSAAQLGVSPLYASVSERLLQYALQSGYDDIDGGAFNRAFPDQTDIDRSKGAWEQAECLHAMIAAAAESRRSELWRRYEQTLALVSSTLVDTQNGGWHAGPVEQCQHGGCFNDEQSEPYHMTSMHMAAISAAGNNVGNGVGT